MGGFSYFGLGIFMYKDHFVLDFLLQMGHPFDAFTIKFILKKELTFKIYVIFMGSF